VEPAAGWLGAAQESLIAAYAWSLASYTSFSKIILNPAFCKLPRETSRIDSVSETRIWQPSEAAVSIRLAINAC
jgi:hypothetical protein